MSNSSQETKGSIGEICRGLPLVVSLSFVDPRDGHFGENLAAAMAQAATPGGQGTLFYAVGRRTPDVPVAEGPHVRKFVPVAVVLPYDQFRRLTLRGESAGPAEVQAAAETAS